MHRVVSLTRAGDGAQAKAHPLRRLKFGHWGGLDPPEARLDRRGPHDGGVTRGGQHGGNGGGKWLRLELILLQLQVSRVGLQGLREGGRGAHVVQVLVVFRREEGGTGQVGCQGSEFGTATSNTCVYTEPAVRMCTLVPGAVERTGGICPFDRKFRSWDCLTGEILDTGET